MCELFNQHIVKLGNDILTQRETRMMELPLKDRDKDGPGGAGDPQLMKVIGGMKLELDITQFELIFLSSTAI